MSNNKRNWFVRAYRDGDEEGIFELCRAVYPEKKYDRRQWLARWHWQHEANPVGKGLVYLAEQNGRIVGQAAEVPLMMKIGMDSVLASLSVDAMTHPDFRRQGMYASLLEATCAESRSRGIRVTYSFPNKVSYLVGQRPEVIYVAAMQKVVKPLNWRNAMRTQTKNSLLVAIGAAAGSLLDAVILRDRKPPVLKGLTIVQVSHFDERIDALWGRVSPQYQVAVVRNREYLNWRYVAIPDTDYLIYVAEQAKAMVGYLVVSRTEEDQARIGTILDIFAESEGIARCLISEVVERCRDDRLDLLWGAQIAGTPLARALRRSGFLPVPFPKSYGRLQHWHSPSLPMPGRLLHRSLQPHPREDEGGTGPSLSSCTIEQLQDPRNWLLQMGDSDEA